MNMAVSPAHARRAIVVLGVALILAAGGPGGGQAEQVELADGRILEGGFALATSVFADPLAADREAAEPVLVCDDGLTRTMVAKRQVVRIEPGPREAVTERLLVPQRVATTGRRVIGIGGGSEATPFDEHGRRILSLSTESGRVDVVQGITEITPRWVRIEGLQTEKPLRLDMRMATTSIPRDVLRQVIAGQIDRRNSDQRLRLVRLLVQAERYAEAVEELAGVVAEFPDLADLSSEKKSIARLAATQILDELMLRGRSGQDRLALRLLESFPIDEADGEVLEAVREARDDYRDRLERAARLATTLRERVAHLSDDGDRAAADAVAGEIERELSFATLGRLATFERLGTAADMPADRGVALAVTGWLRMPPVDNLKVALSAVRVRDLLRRYLVETATTGREELLRRLRNEEATSAETIAAIAAAMRPPIDPPVSLAPGLHELTVDDLDGRGSVSCLVQLPPEYDPLRRYPTIVTLHAPFTTPLNQIEWWAGVAAADGGRLGQAARHGMIVIAPRWLREHQSAHDYSPREHHAVLASLRAASRSFAIDSDRVFLTGHSRGAEAAWDIALAHPDLWAGLVAIAPTADRYIPFYWPNARSLPIYIVGGELDTSLLPRSAGTLDRLFSKGFDVTYVEYRGRGHESFSDEILRIFDWMGRRRRTFFPPVVDAVSMRPSDRFFWWVEFESAPPRTVVLPGDWPPPTGTRPLTIDAKLGATNSVAVRVGADRVRVWLSPELVDFTRPLTITVDGRQMHKGPIAADLEVLLEDLRLRGDLQHPFWAVIDSVRGRR
jgi:predicted esterase